MSRVSPRNTWLPAEISAWIEGSCPPPAGMLLHSTVAQTACLHVPAGRSMLWQQLLKHWMKFAKTERNCVKRDRLGNGLHFHNNQAQQNFKSIVIVVNSLEQRAFLQGSACTGSRVTQHCSQLLAPGTAKLESSLIPFLWHPIRSFRDFKLTCAL